MGLIIGAVCVILLVVALFLGGATQAGCSSDDKTRTTPATKQKHKPKQIDAYVGPCLKVSPPPQIDANVRVCLSMVAPPDAAPIDARAKNKPPKRPRPGRKCLSMMPVCLSMAPFGDEKKPRGDLLEPAQTSPQQHRDEIIDKLRDRLPKDVLDRLS